MIICNSSNIDIIQGNISYGNAVEGITDWCLENTRSGIFNILNSTSTTPNISIIDNGNVGIGTVPTPTSSKLEIIGDINISGNYRKNNRDIISDTSNYVLSTSNILSTNLKEQWWTNVSSGIYYTGISNPNPNPITSSPAATATGITGNYTYMQFTYTTETAGAGTGQSLYTINVPTCGVMCDILIVGGGGGGGNAIYNSSHEPGGGGAGGVVYMVNKNLSAGTYKINVGNGGAGNTNGNNSTITDNNNNSLTFDNILLIGKGGGKGATGYQTVGSDGGSGGGGGHNRANGGTTTQGNTFWNGTTYIAGGNNGAKPGGSSSGGGGGGAGEAGDTDGGGFGGDGVQVSITGTNTFYAGGGNAYYNTSTTRSDGGGGTLNGTGSQQNGGSALPNTGSGGSGAYLTSSSTTGGSGGSGIVIIRYLYTTNVGIGTTNPISKLHVYDDTTNATTLTIQNNYTEPVTIIFPNSGYALAETIENNIYYRTLTFTYSLLKNYPIIPPIPGNPTSTTLLAWYRFNGDSLDYNTSATKYDLIANTGNPTYSSGTTTDSFFQGLRYINTGTGSLRNTSLSLASRAFSIAVWQRKKNSSIALFIAQSASVGGNISLYIGQRENNVYTIDYYGNGLNSASSYPEDINAWVHVVYVVLSNNNRRIYRNGVLIATDSNTTAFTGSGDLRIGVLYSDNTANQNIDFSDLRIYTTGLSATDVATLYSSYTPLLAWYRFDGDGLDYNPYSTKYNLVAGTGTAPTYPTELFQGRKFLSTVSGTIKNSTIALKQRALSVSVWIRNKTLAANQFFLSQCQSAATNLAVQFGHNGNCGYILSVFNADLTAGMGTGTQTTYPGDLNVWVHLVYVIETNYNKKIYRNGVLIAFDTNTNAFSGTADLIVGATFTNIYVNADLSDLRIYTVGLSATDVATLYASYSNIVTNDNYSVNFVNTSKILVNGASKTVNGMYSIYTGDSNSSMLPLSNQSDIPLATTTSTGTSSVVVKYAYNQNILPPIISGAGITSTIVGNTDVCSIFTYTGTPATNTNTTYTFTTTKPYLCDILIIGGGGAGGNSMGAGGGAGGVVYAINQILPASTYKVNVGRGGIGLNLTDKTGQGTIGIDQDGTESSLMNSDGSSYISLTLGGVSQQLRGLGGGGGGIYYNTSFLNGRSGGSGGGCAEANPLYGLNTPGSATQGNTYWDGSAYVVGGKAGRQNTTTASDYQGGGGGGLGDVSSDYRNGNSGVSINITGESRFYAAGGGAGQYSGGGSTTSTTAGLGGSFVGGNGRIWNGSAYATAPRDVATSGTNSTGSGGGGGANTQAPVSVAGSGGSGIVIIRYRETTSSSIELIRGSINDSNRDYKIGNYNGDFIVKSSINSTDNDNIKITGSTGSITNPTGTTTWTTASDRRIKENIERASYDKCYESINKLELNRFNYINGFNTINRDITQLGFIAQEVKEIFPKSVFENSYINNNINISDLHSIDITQINYTLYGAVKKLIEIINDDEEKIKKLERILKIDIDNTLTSNLILDTVLTSNIDISSTSNIDIDKMLTSNIDIDSISIITE